MNPCQALPPLLLPQLQISRDFDSLIGTTSNLPYTVALAVYPVPPFHETLIYTNHIKSLAYDSTVSMHMISQFANCLQVLWLGHVNLCSNAYVEEGWAQNAHPASVTSGWTTNYEYYVKDLVLLEFCYAIQGLGRISVGCSILWTKRFHLVYPGIPHGEVSDLPEARWSFQTSNCRGTPQQTGD